MREGRVVLKMGVKAMEAFLDRESAMWVPAADWEPQQIGVGRPMRMSKTGRNLAALAEGNQTQRSQTFYREVSAAMANTCFLDEVDE